ncbi:Ref family recombination enhancement nuclease [Cupriavidus numazuensis]|uniref:Ref family recombination enhancement nuclease n=1 Tax=Cupriavidus numazuensis TaxID=221992 RepID=UPI001BAAFE0D|nr:Ref family recombination enhancement nuclease [Cupriavidus numazuensis]
MKRTCGFKQGGAQLARTAAEAKPTKAPKRMRAKRKQATAAERRYMGHVQALGCMLCQHLGLGKTAAIVHHQRTGQGAMRASHYRTVGLCPAHHQHSGYGVHDMGRPQFAAMYGVSEVELVERVRTILVAHLPANEV